MRIGGFQKVSLIDYPGQISSVIFTQGCNFRCPYCHNPELVDPLRYEMCIEPDGILAYLDSRRGKIDAVTMSGGEPTLQGDLLDFIGRIREMGYLIKVDTNGSRPDVLDEMTGLGVIDFIAMDIKAPLERYGTVAQIPVEAATIMRSINIIMKAGIDYEFRTTVLPVLTTPEDLVMIAETIQNARRYVLQSFVPAKVLDSRLNGEKSFTVGEMNAIKTKLEKIVSRVVVRA
jgi:pyruvate formate lyase activating enzyme